MIFREIKRGIFFFGLLLVAISAQAQKPALVFINGVDRSICDIFRSGRCIGQQWDNGTVTITLNGINVSTIYGKTSTGNSLASALAAKIPVSVPGMSASVSGGTVSVTPSDFTNFSITASAVSSDPVTFGGSSFDASVSDQVRFFPSMSYSLSSMLPLGTRAL